jgi:hypothetical protein
MRRERSLLLDAGTLGTSSAVPAFEAPSPQLLWLPPDQEGTLGLMTASPYAHAQMHGQVHGHVHGQKSKAESVRFSSVLPLWSSATSNGRGFKGNFGDSECNSIVCVHPQLISYVFLYTYDAYETQAKGEGRVVTFAHESDSGNFAT